MLSHTRHHDAELALVVRGGFPESRHRGFAVAIAGDGSMAAALGDPDTPILPRSTLKPFQAIASLRAGAGLAGEHLAIATGSHDGSEAHLGAVRAILASAGVDEDALGCPPALPGDPEALRAATTAAVRDRGASNAPEPRRIWHNCSGKHAGMLAACVASGWDPATYLGVQHPLQEMVREVISEAVGAIHATAVDGCGAPVHAVTVRDLATAYARLPWADPDGVRVAEAMRAHPVMVGGATADDTRLMQLLPGSIAKRGAEGVLAVSAPGGGGVAVKVSDGSMRAAMVVAIHLLGMLGVETAPAAALGHAAVLGGGLPVGSIEPSIGLLRAAQGE